MKASILFPSTTQPPPELALYRVERAFAERLNVQPAPLPDWPERKVADYLVIMRMEDEVESARQKTGQPAGNADATEAAYQRLKVAAQPADPGSV